MSRVIHLCMSVRGALRDWTPRHHGVLIRDDGSRATAEEYRTWLFDQLAKGHEVVPVGPACEGFDYAGGGCPGHDEPEDEQPITDRYDLSEGAPFYQPEAKS